MYLQIRTPSDIGTHLVSAALMGLSTKNGAAITGHGPDGSVIAERYMTGQWQHAKGEFIPERYPTNREVAKAIEQKVSVRTCCKLDFAAH